MRLEKLKGGGALPPRANRVQVLRGFVGGTAGIVLLAYLGQWSGLPWLMAPFGATCVLLFAVPGSPLAQPRNVIGGHLLTCVVGLVLLYSFGQAPWVLAVGVGAGIALMQLLHVVHPPAGANPLVVILLGTAHIDASFLLTPVLTGSVGLILIAAIVNNIGQQSRWPMYWLGKRAD
ncbi:HPP family protein [Pokkaliibacter sp. CJK22405]|uniref:HPP family protein n=1 Tax=Pokkaliibacter sp. CJK22405 TaxID=3384615 RepID=UPI00398501F1